MAETVLALDELTVRFRLRRGDLTAVDAFGEVLRPRIDPRDAVHDFPGCASAPTELHRVRAAVLAVAAV